MRDELATVLRLVSEGKLSPDEAAPLIEALGRTSGARAEAVFSRDTEGADRPAGESTRRDTRQVRIRVTERGRQVVNLRIPIAFAERALRVVPGISAEQSDQIRAAIAGGLTGPIFDVEDEDGDGIVISME